MTTLDLIPCLHSPRVERAKPTEPMKNFHLFFPSGGFIQIQAESAVLSGERLTFIAGGRIVADFRSSAIAGFREL